MSQEWRRRTKGTANQIGKPFPVTQPGSKRNLPKGLKIVTRRRIIPKGEDEEIIEEVQEEMEEDKEQEGIIERNKKELKEFRDKINRDLEKDEIKKIIRERRHTTYGLSGDRVTSDEEERYWEEINE